MKSIAALLGFSLILWPLHQAAAADPVQEIINPFPRQHLPTKRAFQWTFAAGTEGWVATHACTVKAGDGVLTIKATEDDPYLHSGKLPVDVAGPVQVRLRLKCRGQGAGEIFWTTRKAPNWSPKRRAGFELRHDGQWHDYEVVLDFSGTLQQIRLDPGSGPGDIEVERIEVWPMQWHPLEIESVEAADKTIRFRLRNHGDAARSFTAMGQSFRIAAKTAQMFAVPVEGRGPFKVMALTVQSAGLPALERSVFVHRPGGEKEWVKLAGGPFTVQVASDGSGIRWLRGQEVIALAAPLVQVAGVTPKLQLKEQGGTLRFEGDGVKVDVTPTGDEVAIAIDSPKPCEGPVLRPQGSLEQGVFAGQEYLGKGESSSSKLDIETAEHLRFAPPPLQITMPLMVCRTTQVTAAMTWTDMTLQPTFAAPNFYDGAAGQRMSLRGRKIEAIMRVNGQSLEDAILWAARKKGLPPLPQSPRSLAQQKQLCLDAINGPLKNANGWGHCAEPSWGRQPYADVASTLYRLTGKVPELPRLVPGGAHLKNDAIYFVSGRAEEWLQMRRGQVAGLIKGQKEDGSYRYQGQYRRAHFEDTSSGLCAPQAAMLLEWAKLTGDRAAQEAGLKTLEFMKRFRTPRGAQTWELSLHTPDILASAYLVQAYVYGHELTGKKEYLELARKWALSGVPFVYLWGNRPVMTYATIPVYGATNWVAPNWIGLPVQWCGLVYADALLKLAPHDNSLDWKHLAHGILIAGEQMQFPSGSYVGCLPDAFSLPDQGRRGPSINPGALVSLRLAIAGEPAGLAVASENGHHIVAPFPVVACDGLIQIQARAGVRYQVVIDGKRIVEVTSKGVDTITLANVLK